MNCAEAGEDSGLVSLDRTNLARRTRRVLSKGGWGNPDVLLVERTSGGAELVVVKDFAVRSRWVRILLGRWLLRREERAYRRLSGIPAVPLLLGRVDMDALILEYRPGTLLSRSLAGHIPSGFMTELEESIQAMHGRGVVHLDLRHRSNILAGEDGKPVLIDFASALFFNPKGWLGSGLLHAFASIDRSAVEKWRVRLVPPGTGSSR